MTREQADKAVQLGLLQGEQRLAVVEAGMGVEEAIHYAVGMASASRDYLLHHGGAAVSYEMCSQLADQVMDVARGWDKSHG